MKNISNEERGQPLEKMFNLDEPSPQQLHVSK
jgi:hypothetical protein